MRTLTLFLSLLLAGAANAQTVADFENPVLPGTDTAYVNYLQPGQDVGFTSGLAYFPCVYDTGFGSKFWAGGFAYSNERDTVTGTYANEYAAKTGLGYNNSAQYTIYFEPYGGVRRLRLTGPAAGQAVSGFFITNTTLVYHALKNGDFFMGPRFGDTSVTDTTHARPDFLKVVAKGYRNGVLKQDSVEFYLADFRAASNANDYIVKNWTWFSLLSLGAVDSLDFRLVSSRNNSFGNLVPAYFAMDNFITDESATRVRKEEASYALRVYPNPATDWIQVVSSASIIDRVEVIDATGRVLLRENVNKMESSVDLNGIVPGIYHFFIHSAAGVATHRFVKQ